MTSILAKFESQKLPFYNFRDSQLWLLVNFLFSVSCSSDCRYHTIFTYRANRSRYPYVPIYFSNLVMKFLLATVHNDDFFTVILVSFLVMNLSPKMNFYDTQLENQITFRLLAMTLILLLYSEWITQNMIFYENIKTINLYVHVEFLPPSNYS